MPRDLQFMVAERASLTMAKNMGKNARFPEENKCAAAAFLVFVHEMVFDKDTEVTVWTLYYLVLLDDDCIM